jgi:hypothetical protein
MLPKLAARELPYTRQSCVQTRNNQGHTRDSNRVTEVLAMIQDMGER